MDTLKDWLTDGQFLVGAVLGLLGVLVGAWGVLRARQPKVLDYKVVNRVALLSPHARSWRGKLELSHDKVPLVEPYLVTLRIQNSGKKAVRAADYVEPIRVLYESNPPFDGFISGQSRKGMYADDGIFDMSGKYDLPRVEMKPVLLNRGEWYEIQLFSDGDPGEVKVTSVFADQDRPMREVSATTAKRQGQVLMGVAVAAGASTALLATGANAESSAQVLAGFAVLLGLVLSIVLDRRNVKRQKLVQRQDPARG